MVSQNTKHKNALDRAPSVVGGDHFQWCLIKNNDNIKQQQKTGQHQHMQSSLNHSNFTWDSLQWSHHPLSDQMELILFDHSPIHITPKENMYGMARFFRHD